MSEDRYRLALQAVALAAIQKHVAAQSDAVRAKLADELEPGLTVRARLHNGERVGSVLLTDPDPTVAASVVNEAVLTAWIAERYPHQVHQMVRPAFLTAVLAASKQAGTPMTPDGEADVPGILVETRHPSPVLQVRPDMDAIEKALPPAEDWLEAVAAIGDAEDDDARITVG